MAETRNIRGEASIVIGGAAGQGIQTIERLLPHFVKLSGYHVCTTKEYMSRIRGGSNSTEIRISSRPAAAWRGKADLLLPLDRDALSHLQHRITDDTIIVGDREKLGTEREVIDVPTARMAREAGSAVYENVIGAGIVAGAFSLDHTGCEEYLTRHFAGKNAGVVSGNIHAFRLGRDRGEALLRDGVLEVAIETDPGRNEDMLVSGAEACALGALAAGCNFIAAYPMTPSTGVFAFLARHAAEFDLVAEQAEDEIAAINMSLGAWYAGARSMVTTSGGGFALMAEGLSLSGMIESPAVIFLSQRPGPATGLPTRTEQGDLLFALFAGHGEFPRVVLTPGTLRECFDLTAAAFEIADRFQVPVIVMADQFLVDLQHNVPPFDEGAVTREHHFVETEREYRRYALSESGLSPRGIPGFGRGLVCVDSDEHDEDGHITEDHGIRTAMMEKRLRKASLLGGAVPPPRLFGSESFETLVVGWGSTCGVIREALDVLDVPEVSHLHLTCAHPFHESVAPLLRRARRTIVVENNATGQLASLLRMSLGVESDEAILRYDGLPFSPGELAVDLSGKLP